MNDDYSWDQPKSDKPVATEDDVDRYWQRFKPLTNDLGLAFDAWLDDRRLSVDVGNDLGFRWRYDQGREDFVLGLRLSGGVKERWMRSTDDQGRKLRFVAPYNRHCRLDELKVWERGSDTVLLFESETDVWAVAGTPLGRASDLAMMPKGAGNWRREWGEGLAGYHRVVVMTDADAPGDEQAQRVAATVDCERLRPTAADDWCSALTMGEVPDLANTTKEARMSKTDKTNDLIGVSRRFIEHHMDRVRFVADVQVWLVWDGQRWMLDAGALRVQELAKSAVLALHDEAKEALRRGEDGAHKALAGLARSSASQIDKVVKLARSAPEVMVLSKDLDAHPYLLNCTNGTVDLRTGELRPHDPADLITKLTDRAYLGQEWRGGEFERMLERVLPDPEIRAYVQRLAGYTLIGELREHVMVFLEGPPRTGKSTFVEALRRALGDYAVTAPVELFLQGRSGPRYEMAQVRGARLVAMAEFDEQARVNVSLVKQVTGGDALSAREIYGKAFTFKPQAIFWVSTNHFPWVGSDAAAWARVRRVPFNVSFLGEEDVALPERIARDPAVLAWAVEGCVEYCRMGLADPVSVLVATDDMRASQDTVARFVDEACDLDEEAMTPSGELYRAYVAWCADNGEKHPVTSNRFGARMGGLGFEERRTKSARCRQGLVVSGSVPAF